MLSRNKLTDCDVHDRCIYENMITNLYDLTKDRQRITNLKKGEMTTKQPKMNYGINILKTTISFVGENLNSSKIGPIKVWDIAE